MPLLKERLNLHNIQSNSSTDIEKSFTMEWKVIPVHNPLKRMSPYIIIPFGIVFTGSGFDEHRVFIGSMINDRSRISFIPRL